MSTFRISEAADRSGFSASALRYYERVGLVVPERTAAGYRAYDDRQIAKLRFLAEAKALGVTLEEARELLSLWDEDACGTVAAELRGLLAGKVSEVLGRAEELTGFADRLRIVAACLEEVPETAACGEDCACIGVTDEASRAEDGSAAGPTTSPVPDVSSPAPSVACSLHVDDRAGRVEDWRRVAARARGDRRTEGGRALRFDPGEVEVRHLAELMAAEQSCCRFFEFGLRLSASEVELEVRAPDGAESFIEAILGPAA